MATFLTFCFDCQAFRGLCLRGSGLRFPRIGWCLKSLELIHDRTPARVAPDVDRCPSHIEHSIDGKDDALHLCGQANGLQDDGHHHESRVWDPGGADTRQQSGQCDNDLLANWQIHTKVHLSDE